MAASKVNKNSVAGNMDRFKDAQAKNIAAAKKLVEDYVSSSDEDELDEKAILDKLFKHYNESTKEKSTGTSLKTAGIFENILHSGAASCLICIGTLKRADSIWSCRHCYCMLHLNCIKRWANDSIAQHKANQQNQAQEGHYNHLGEYVPPPKRRSAKWYCPQCRNDYEPSERPNNYECFCGKEVNPKVQPWLVPHSCGEICGRGLKPDCGHKCMLLCHPGPCPPCSQYTNVSCLCGKSSRRTVRCVDKAWQCAIKCDLKLSCSQHKCNQVCHLPNKCPPCASTSVQSCKCGHERKERNCADLVWQCKKVCSKKYECGLHVCKKVCHDDVCGECPLGLPRTCPCGKTEKIGPCSQTVEPCGDTCQKLLPCGQHLCTQRCHRGKCNECLIIIKKKCRCGIREKDLPCSKEFTCETKCKQMRDCGKHSCNRKCCDGCLPCDKVCGKPLSCGKHKCLSICHDGPCYPCRQSSQVNCRCGKTSKNVPCGSERKSKIACLEPCRIPSKCHHTSKHKCHKNECPPCNQRCGLPNDTSRCGHTCEAKCHAAVKTRKTDSTNAWDKNKIYEFINLPHPQCNKMISVQCIGGHEICDWPCWNSKPSSCQRKCQRLLRCGSHKCELVCHSVENPEDMKEQGGCASCQDGCNVPRPIGCVHPCPRPCHQPPCFECKVVIKSKCHCGLTHVMYKCSEFFASETYETNCESILQRQERLLSCGDRCIKNFPCGHRCNNRCHSGKCPNPEQCRKKVKIYCECKHLKSEIACDKHRAGQTMLECNQSCNETRLKIEKTNKLNHEKLQQQEDAKNRHELEMFEKKFGKRKYKERKVVVEKQSSDINWKTVSICVGTASIVLLAVLVAFYADN